METSRKKWWLWLAAIAVGLALFIGWIRYGNPTDRSIAETSGREPVLAEPETETFPTVSLARTVGWAAGEAPQAAKGLAVARFADGLNHPRTILVLPNGDVIVAETAAPAGANSGGLTGAFQGWFKSLVGAGDPSPNRLVLLRDGNNDGRAEVRHVLREKGLSSPSGMAFRDGVLYVANHDAVLAFAFTPGETSLDGAPRKVMDLPEAGNHWMRNLLLNAEGNRLYVAVGSASNIGENGMGNEEGRAAIWEIDLKTGRPRQYAGGLRNPNGMDWNPSTGELWTVVNERDMLGPDLVPDYLTNVPVGAQYGWPWVYWKDLMDWRVKEPIPDYLTEYTRKPEYALGAHTAPLGLAFSVGGNLMGTTFANGAFVARHGSWNRKPLSGYDVVFVRFDERGNPDGMPLPVLTGFLTGKDNTTHGRPVWLAWDKPGALLVSDDTGGVIWRVLAPGAKPGLAPKKVVTAPMPPQRELKGGPEAQFQASFRPEEDEGR